MSSMESISARNFFPINSSITGSILYSPAFLNIYYSKFAKDHFFLVKYFCFLRKLHKSFCVS